MVRDGLPAAPEPGRYRVVAGESGDRLRLERLGAPLDEHRTIFTRVCQVEGMRPSQIDRLWERAEDGR